MMMRGEMGHSKHNNENDNISLKKGHQAYLLEDFYLKLDKQKILSTILTVGSSDRCKSSTNEGMTSSGDLKAFFSCKVA